jgi:hypothetical protein
MSLVVIFLLLLRKIGENLCKIRTDHAAENFSLLEKMVLNLVKVDTSEKLRVPNKRKLAG